MSTLTFDLPDSVKKNIEELAAREGFSVGQFLASAASEKLARPLLLGSFETRLISHIGVANKIP